MANITIRTLRPAHTLPGIGDGRFTEVAGEIAIVGRNNAYPAGSFKLRTVHQIEFPTCYTARRQVIGSAVGAVGPAGVNKFPSVGNSVVIIPIVTGSTGTRLATMATLGSAFPTGTVITSFRAYGR